MHFVWFKMPGLDLQVPPWSSKAWCYSTHFRITLVLFINNRTMRKYIKYKLLSLYKNHPSPSLGQFNHWVSQSASSLDLNFVSSSSLSENEHVKKFWILGLFVSLDFILCNISISKILSCIWMQNENNNNRTIENVIQRLSVNKRSSVKIFQPLLACEGEVWQLLRHCLSSTT